MESCVRLGGAHATSSGMDLAGISAVHRSGWYTWLLPRMHLVGYSGGAYVCFCADLYTCMWSHACPRASKLANMWHHHMPNTTFAYIWHSSALQGCPRSHAQFWQHSSEYIPTPTHPFQKTFTFSDTFLMHVYLLYMYSQVFLASQCIHDSSLWTPGVLQMFCCSWLLHCCAYANAGGVVLLATSPWIRLLCSCVR